MTPLHLAVALDGAGWHPAAWRDPAARPADLFTAGYWAELAGEAERGLLDFITIEDALGLQPTRHPDSGAEDGSGAGSGAGSGDGSGDGDRNGSGDGGAGGRVLGRLDAVLLAARLAPVTSRIGLVPTTSTTHTEPFHLAIGIASLDFASNGRAGWRPQISARPADAAHFGRRSFSEIPHARTPAGGHPGPEWRAFVAELLDEAADAVEVVRRLWDSWEDDAEIRDTATGRFIDRDKLHYIDFVGPHFSVRGPSITPRSPQGQPLITALAHDTEFVPADRPRPASRPQEFAARAADVVYVTPRTRSHAAAIAGRVREAEARAGRRGPALKIFADLVVFVDAAPGAAAERRARLDALDGAGWTSDAEIFTGTPGELADLLLDWRPAGLDGFRLRPGVLPYDLVRITRDLVPELRRRGMFRTGYEAVTLRGHLGLERPANRYAGTS